MDLKAIANARGYGTGQAARDKLARAAAGRTMIVDPSLMCELYARSSMSGYMVGSLGHCLETDADWYLEHESELGMIDGVDDTASNNAKAIAAVWNAYRDGDLVWRSAK